jgi:hypothetical protein
VLLIPEWTQPTLSQEAVRLNGGVAPPPEPILPSEFTIQLYNPDQQVVVRQKPGSWNTTPHWEFEMPQQTFRQPSTSALDRTQNDPAASDTTPKINFKWQKDGKLTKDLVCKLSGKTTNPDGSKRKNREPDITVAIFKQLRELTLYEPNLYRVEMEDPKGLEVVLLLGAIVIRDVYFGQMRQTFNISEATRRDSSDGRGRKSSSPAAALVDLVGAPVIPPRQTNITGPLTSPYGPNSGRPPNPSINIPIRESRPPPTDPRSQWEIDAETARLKKQAEVEERERKRQEAAETKRVKRMLEAEERETRRKQEEVEKETKRLQKLYGKEQQEQILRPSLPPRTQGPQRHSAPQVPVYQPQGYWPQQPQPQPGPYQPGPYQPGPYGPYLGVPGQQPRPSTSGFFSEPGGLQQPPQRLKEKRSFFGFKREIDDGGGRLQKKKSAIF